MSKISFLISCIRGKFQPFSILFYGGYYFELAGRYAEDGRMICSRWLYLCTTYSGGSFIASLFSFLSPALLMGFFDISSIHDYHLSGEHTLIICNASIDSLIFMLDIYFLLLHIFVKINMLDRGAYFFVGLAILHSGPIKILYFARV